MSPEHNNSDTQHNLLIVAGEPFRQTLLDAFKDFATVIYEPEAWREPDKLVQLGKSADVFLTRNLTPISKNLLGRLSNLKCVAVYGAGREHLDMSAIREHEIKLIRCSKEVSSTIAEFTLGLALCLLRRIPEASKSIENRKWDHTDLIGKDLAGKKILVVGCGAIGQQVALLFRLLGSKVTIARKSSKPIPAALKNAGCRQGALIGEIKVSDIVTIHVSGGKTTENLIGKTELEMMKRGSYLINTSRGSVVEFSAVFSALCEDRLAGAALDVLPQEPPEFPLPQHPKLIYTPHLALYSEEAIRRRIKYVVGKVRHQVLEHKKIKEQSP